MNKNKGEFDDQLLKQFFDVEMLEMVGFTDKALLGLENEFKKKFDSYNDQNCEMPIVPQFNEKYKVVMIMAKTELDGTWLKNFLGIQKAQCYKSTTIAENYCIDVSQLQALLEEKMEEEPDA